MKLVDLINTQSVLFNKNKVRFAVSPEGDGEYELINTNNITDYCNREVIEWALDYDSFQQLVLLITLEYAY